MELRETIRKQLRELTGIEEDQYPSEYRQHQLFTGLSDPPTYFVYMLFLSVGFSCYSGEEKTKWETYLRFKGMHFRIRDWKNSTWSIDSIDSLPDYAQAKEVAEELKRRIGKASRKPDILLEPLFQEFVADNRFFRHNSYHQIRGLYEYFRDQAECAQNKSEQIDLKSSASQGSEDGIEQFFEKVRQKRDLEWVAGYNACAMVAFFFSYSELVLDILFILSSDQARTFEEFRKFRGMSWKERFVTTLPTVAKNTSPAKIYKDLIVIRDRWRHVLLHGFNDDTALLVPIPGIGLIPISYAAASKAIHFTSLPVPEGGAQLALQAFSSFDQWLLNDECAHYAVLFAKSGLPIPFEQTRLTEIRGWMSSRTAFEQALGNEADIEQAWLNLYQ